MARSATCFHAKKGNSKDANASGRQTSAKQTGGQLSRPVTKRAQPKAAPSVYVAPGKSKQLKRTTPASSNLEKYIDQASNPVDYILEGGDAQRNPNSAGTTTFLGSYVTTLEHTVDCPYFGASGIEAGVNSSLFIATNGVSQERFLRSAPSAIASGLTQLEGEFVIQVATQTTIGVNDTFGTAQLNYAEGIMTALPFNSSSEVYVAALPTYSGRPAWLFNWAATGDTTVNFTVRCNEYHGNVGFNLYTLNGANSWTLGPTIFLNLKGATSVSGSVTYPAAAVVNALSIGVYSTAQQELRFSAQIYVSTDTGSFGVIRHQNLLIPGSLQFDSEVTSGLLREYWPVAAGEILTNTTAVIDMGGVGYSVSTQRFAGLYNASGAATMDELITKNKIHFYTGAANNGLSGHSVPRAVQPDPLPFSMRGWGSDCRMYLIKSAKPQTFNIAYGTVICGLGKRSGSIAYGVTSYPPWWPMVVEALVMVNPMSCNPDHTSMFGKAYQYVIDFLSKPGAVDKLLSGAITAADLASLAFESSFPRVSGGADQVSRALQMFQ